jgi:mRNA interferase MazF
MKKGDVCIVDLLQNTGREQFGMRPAIILSDTETDIVVVVPLTSNNDALRFPFTFAISPDGQNNINHKSTVLIFHIQSIDKSKIIKTIGKLNKNHRDKIDGILRKMLGV